MLKLQLIILHIFLYLSGFGQSSFGFKANAGVSWIKNPIVAEETNWKTLIAPSGHTGLFVHIDLSNKLIFGTELLLVQIEGRERVEIDAGSLTIGGGGAGNIAYIIDFNYHLSNLAVPIYLGFKSGDITVNIGGQIHYVFRSSANKRVQNLDSGLTPIKDADFTDQYVGDIDYGMLAGLQYKVSDKLAVEWMTYYGISNLFSEDSWLLSGRQISIGLRYFFNDHTQDEE